MIFETESPFAETANVEPISSRKQNGANLSKTVCVSKTAMKNKILNPATKSSSSSNRLKSSQNNHSNLDSSAPFISSSLKKSSGIWSPATMRFSAQRLQKAEHEKINFVKRNKEATSKVSRKSQREDAGVSEYRTIFPTREHSMMQAGTPKSRNEQEAKSEKLALACLTSRNEQEKINIKENSKHGNAGTIIKAHTLTTEYIHNLVRRKFSELLQTSKEQFNKGLSVSDEENFDQKVETDISKKVTKIESFSEKVQSQEENIRRFKQQTSPMKLKKC